MLKKILEGLDYIVEIKEFGGSSEIKITSNNFTIPEMDKMVKLWDHFKTLVDKKNQKVVELGHNLRAEDNKITLEIKAEYFGDISEHLYKYKVSNRILFDMYEQTVVGPNAIYTLGGQGFVVASSFFLKVELKNDIYTDWDKKNTNTIELSRPNQNKIYSFNNPAGFGIVSANWITQEGHIGEL